MLRSSGLLSLPHQSTPSDIKQDTKIQPSGDPSIHLSFQKEVKLSQIDVIGHLMVDEIKIKNGIAFNVQNNEIAGFMKEQLNTKQMFGKILNISTKRRKKIS